MRRRPQKDWNLAGANQMSDRSRLKVDGSRIWLLNRFLLVTKLTTFIIIWILYWLRALKFALISWRKLNGKIIESPWICPDILLHPAWDNVYNVLKIFLCFFSFQSLAECRCGTRLPCLGFLAFSVPLRLAAASMSPLLSWSTPLMTTAVNHLILRLTAVLHTAVKILLLYRHHRCVQCKCWNSVVCR